MPQPSPFEDEDVEPEEPDESDEPDEPDEPDESDELDDFDSPEDEAATLSFFDDSLALLSPSEPPDLDRLGLPSASCLDVLASVE